MIPDGTALIRKSCEGLLKKRKLVTVKNLKSGIMLNKRISMDQNDSQPPPLTEFITQLIIENQNRNIAMVVVDITLIPSLCNCNIGDNVMVMGEICEREHKTGSQLGSNRLDEALHMLYRLKNCDDHCNMDDDKDRIKYKHDLRYAVINARILRNSSGLDVSIFEEALSLRRKYMKEQGAQTGTGFPRI
jgi:hypothetical protein